MGFKNKNKINFVPLDLTEENVQTIFNRCVSTNPDKTSSVHALLFSKALGYKEDSRIIYFDKEKLKRSSQAIFYLYGQLADTHKKSDRISPSSIITNYNGEIWTSNSGVIMDFLYLGNAVNIIIPFEAQKNNTASFNNYLTPTLSPKDPKFAEWYKGYEAKMKKAEGPTPDEK